MKLPFLIDNNALIPVQRTPTHSTRRVRRMLAHFGITLLVALMTSSQVFTSKVVAQPTRMAASMLLDTPGDLYLYNPDGSITDVTSSYVQTGTYYDSTKGYTEQTGTVTDATGDTIDVIVDIRGGMIEDWDHTSIGYVAGAVQPGNIR